MRILSIVAIAAFVVSAVVRAADDKVAASEQAPVASQLEQQDVQVGSNAQVFGKVVSIHNCDLAGMSDPHVLVKLESAPGDVEVVDLGSVAEFKSNGIEPRQGQQFWVDGRVGTINGQLLVVAERLSESKLVTIIRQAPLRGETTKQHAAHHAETGAANEAKDVNDGYAAKTETVDADQQFRTIQGTVVHTSRMKIDGELNEHVLAKIQTESGIAVLDLGTCSTMPNNVDLTVGKSIAASGFVGDLNGKPIILADSVGNLSSIQRPNDPRNVPAKTSIPASYNENSSLRK